MSREIIGSKIGAYFSDDSIKQNWDNLSSAVEEYSYHILDTFPQQNDTNYYYDVCNRLAHILKIYTVYPQNNPINIDRNILNKYHCKESYDNHWLNLQNFTKWKKDQKYFPIRDNKSVDWNALFYYNQTKINAVYTRSVFLLNKDIEDHKNNLLDIIFKSDITAFK